MVGIDDSDEYLAQARFAGEVSGLEVEFRKLSVYDVGVLGDRFDIVLFMGVLYHLRHPLLALDLIHEHVTRDMLVFQSMQRGSSKLAKLKKDYEFWETDQFDWPAYPKLHFIEQRYADDPTNWWVPNRSCAEAMLRGAGFARQRAASFMRVASRTSTGTSFHINGSRAPSNSAWRMARRMMRRTT